MSKAQYVAADEAKLDEIIRQAESRLQAQLLLAIAADQRAMTLASILATGAGALIAWAITHSAGDAHLLPVLLLLGGTVLAAGFALWAASPIAWESPGNTPESWVDDIAEGTDDLKSAKAAMADFYSDMIARNAQLMSGNANSIRAALVTVFLTLIVGGFVAVIFE